jgi:hypothetical protein
MPSKPQPVSSLYKDLRLPAKQAWQKSEDALQIECAKFAKKALYLAGEPQVFHHSPNGGNRTQREASKFKMMGVLAGVPDTFLPLKSGEFCGLYIELKKAGGAPSKEQKQFMNSVANEGYLAIVVNDLATFKEVFTYYIEQRKQQ